jgi:hypothetical protein
MFFNRVLPGRVDGCLLRRVSPLYPFAPDCHMIAAAVPQDKMEQVTTHLTAPEGKALPSARTELRFAARPTDSAVALEITRVIARALPATLVALWVTAGRGVLIVDEAEAPRYEPGWFMWRDVAARGALYLPPGCEPRAQWEVVGGWLDAFAGSFGDADRLSEGHGATPLLAEAAERFSQIVEFGYAADFLGAASAPTLFARAVAAYHLQPQALSAADPLLAKWLRATIFDEGFWRRVSREKEAM